MDGISEGVEVKREPIEEKDEPLQDGEQGPTKRTRLAVCEICSVSDSKYTCPACMVKFCSLGCSKKHKENSACTGVRSKTSYVSMLDFTDTNLISDYQFLEQITHTSDNAKRSIGPQINHSHYHNQQQQHQQKDDSQIPQTQNLPYNLRQIQHQAKKRGIGLHLLPKGMSKMKANTTRYEKDNDKILWRVEWVLNDSFGQPQKMEDKRVDENLTLSAVLSTHFGDIPTRHRFRKLFRDGAEGEFDCSVLKYLIQAEFIKGEKSFHDINPNTPMKEAFAGIHIVEYPIFYVVKQEDLKSYKITPPDENLLKAMQDKSEAQETQQENGDFKGKGKDKERGAKRFYNEKGGFRKGPAIHNQHYHNNNNNNNDSNNDNSISNNNNSHNHSSTSTSVSTSTP
eukprot:TRINITY_DN3245_c0_g1_i2.p1 TRINITY_DN3245_c0_g1~~TRINITY_DN3245_c0_g1_i2.p1  ORF type:complete len:397 (-),score=90.43 TRINITY_DN3245_c0_g1_i2:44-1234(-)